MDVRVVLGEMEALLNVTCSKILTKVVDAQQKEAFNNNTSNKEQGTFAALSPFHEELKRTEEAYKECMQDLETEASIQTQLLETLQVVKTQRQEYQQELKKRKRKQAQLEKERAASALKKKREEEAAAIASKLVGILNKGKRSRTVKHVTFDLPDANDDDDARPAAKRLLRSASTKSLSLPMRVRTKSESNSSARRKAFLPPSRVLVQQPQTGIRRSARLKPTPKKQQQRSSTSTSSKSSLPRWK